MSINAGVVGGRMVDKFVSYVLVWLMLVGVLSVFKLFGSGVAGLMHVGTVFYLVGGLVGLLMGVFDRLVYVYYSRPEESLSESVRKLMKEKKYLTGVSLMYDRGSEQLRLAMNNVIFFGVWLILALFIVSSSSSTFAKGMVMGVGLVLIVDIVKDWKHPDRLIARLFWPIGRRVAVDELKVMVAVFVGMFLMLALGSF